MDFKEFLLLLEYSEAEQEFRVKRTLTRKNKEWDRSDDRKAKRGKFRQDIKDRARARRGEGWKKGYEDWRKRMTAADAGGGAEDLSKPDQEGLDKMGKAIDPQYKPPKTKEQPQPKPTRTSRVGSVRATDPIIHAVRRGLQRVVTGASTGSREASRSAHVSLSKTRKDKERKEQ